MLARYVAATIVLTAAAACADDVPSSPRAGGAPRAEVDVAPPPVLTWLAPLGTGTADSATFDGTAAPVVEVCVWTGAACDGAPVARFTTAPAGGELPLTANAATGRYEAAWSLADARLTTRRTYRVRVLRGAAELGTLSVDVVRGRWALTRTDGTLAPLQAASALPIRFHLAFGPLAPTEIAGILDVQSAAVATLDNAPGVTTISDAMDRVAASLRADPRVAAVTPRGDALLEIRYQNGLTGGVVITEELDDKSEQLRGSGSAAPGRARRGTATHRRDAAVTSSQRVFGRLIGDAAAPGALSAVGSAVVGDATRGRAHWLRAQRAASTRGGDPTARPRRASRFIGAAASAPRDTAKAVRSKRVLIFEASKTEFGSAAEGDAIQALAEQSGFGLQVTRVADDQATAAVLRSLADYGVIVIAGHGAVGSEFDTGELATESSARPYDADLRAGRMRIEMRSIVRRNPANGFIQPRERKNIFVVTDKFIRALPGTFPNSVVVADICEGMASPQLLAAAFRDKGALAYLGYDRRVRSGFAKVVATAFLQELLVDSATVGESYRPSVDLGDYRATWLFSGDPDAHLASAVASVPTVSLTVSPSTVQARLPVTLTFTVRASATTPLTDIYGLPCDVPAPPPNATSYSGSCSINVLADTFGEGTQTYHTYAGAQGADSAGYAEVVVTVTPPPPAPTVSLTVSPSTVEASLPVTLTFTVRASATTSLTYIGGLPCDLPALPPNATSYSGSCSIRTTYSDQGRTYTDTWHVSAEAQGADNAGYAEAVVTVTPARP